MELHQIKDILIIRTNDKIKIGSEIREGSFFGELKMFCEKIKPYAVVMGSQNTTAAERAFFGGYTIMP
ncbi:hypothetical protein [Agriterribacter sp.]|uniref:hypothetical protein n=1 Tax=Agriterribacter sp. TaxID=2821509 RepID=UPI002D7F0C2C|nr:hypothetical protein [Agriterribacter sp.]